MAPPYEPLRSANLRLLTKKALFLLALSTAKRLGELHALSSAVAMKGEDLVVSYLPEFRAKTETESRPLPREYVVRSLSTFVGGQEPDRFLCPVRALRYYLDRVKSVEQRPRSLFVSLKNNSRSLSKNGMSFLLREVISEAQSIRQIKLSTSRGAGPHSIRGYSTCHFG